MWRGIEAIQQGVFGANPDVFDVCKEGHNKMAFCYSLLDPLTFIEAFARFGLILLLSFLKGG